jgi:hypothetical protein
LERAAGPPSPERLLWTTWAGTQPGAGEKVPAKPRCLSPHNTYEERRATKSDKAKQQRITLTQNKWGMGERPLLSCQASV